jgi:hypothetical protein
MLEAHDGEEMSKKRKKERKTEREMGTLSSIQRGSSRRQKRRKFIMNKRDRHRLIWVKGI